MIIKEYQTEELARARELQRELAKLHTPVPVLSWNYEIKNKNGVIVEKGIGKANSYTRNGLNSIAWQAGGASSYICSDSYSNGIIGLKLLDGTLVNPKTDYDTRPRMVYNDKNNTVTLGKGTTAESIDDYKIETASGLTELSNTVNSLYSSTTDILTTVIVGFFENNTAASIDITEAGVIQPAANTSSSIPVDMLLVRDVFTAVTVAVGEIIQWSYVFEIEYPQ